MTGIYIYVSNVIHKAFIEVNEEGSEAAAATAVMWLYASAQVRVLPEFIANHPFLFFIQDNSSGSIFFLAELCNQQEAKLKMSCNCYCNYCN